MGQFADTPRQTRGFSSKYSRRHAAVADMKVWCGLDDKVGGRFPPHRIISTSWGGEKGGVRERGPGN